MTKQLLLMVGTALLLGNGCRTDELANEDVKALQGKWEIVAAENDGKEASNLLTENNLRRVIIKGDRVNVRLQDKDVDIDTDEGEWTFRLFPSKKPKQFEFRFQGRENWLTTLQMGLNREGVKLKEPFKGIYALDNDKLTLCSAWITESGVSKEMPKEFSAPEGSGRLLLTLKRVKP